MHHPKPITDRDGHDFDRHTRVREVALKGILTQKQLAGLIVNN